jgi:hypothetical protein
MKLEKDCSRKIYFKGKSQEKRNMRRETCEEKELRHGNKEKE